FIVGVLIQYAGNYHLFAGTYLDVVANKTHIYRNFLFVGLPFVAIGYLISKTNLESHCSGKVVFIALMGATALLILEGALNTRHVGDYSQTFDVLFSPFLISPLLLILMLKSRRETKSCIYSQLSAGMYFIHPLFL